MSLSNVLIAILIMALVTLLTRGISLLVFLQ